MTIRFWSERSLVNQTTLIDQRDSDVAVLEDGRFVVVWIDASKGLGYIYQRIYNADGTAASDEIVVDDSGGRNRNPVVTALSDGGWVVVHDESGNDRRTVYNADGELELTEVLGDGLFNSFPDAIRVDDGYWIVDVNAGTDNEIDVLRFDAGNAPLCTFSAQSSLTGEQKNPSGAQLTNGHVIIAWRDHDQIEFRIFDSDGAVQTVNGSTDDQTVTDQNVSAAPNDGGAPHVLALENGGFLVTWTASSSPFPGSGADVWGRIYAPDGTPFTDAFLVNSKASGGQAGPVSIALDDGLIMTLFGVSGDADGVRGVIFDTYGNRIGAEFTVDGTVKPNLRDNIDADLLDDGRVVLTWTSTDADLNGSGIFVQIIDPRDGNVIGGGGSETLFGSDQDDRIFADSGNDIVFAGADHDWVFGQNGEDTLHGEDGDDRLFGEFDDDTLFGGGGNDWLDGGAGIDAIHGGAGSDTLSFLTAAAGVSVALFQGSDQVADDGFGNTETVTGIEWVVGSRFGDAILGDFRDNVLQGMEGDDVFFASLGNDFIVGGRGNDFMQGDDGFDAFAFDVSDFESGVFDTIADFSESATSFDSLFLTGLTMSDLTIVDFGGNVFVYTTNAFDTGLVINNFSATQLADQIMFG